MTFSASCPSRKTRWKFLPTGVFFNFLLIMVLGISFIYTTIYLVIQVFSKFCHQALIQRRLTCMCWYVCERCEGICMYFKYVLGCVFVRCEWRGQCAKFLYIWTLGEVCVCEVFVVWIVCEICTCRLCTWDLCLHACTMCAWCIMSMRYVVIFAWRVKCDTDVYVVYVEVSDMWWGLKCYRRRLSDSQWAYLHFKKSEKTEFWNEMK